MTGFCNIGSQLITLNFYFREYTYNDKKLFSEIYGLKTAKVITENLEELSKFNEDWFEENCSLFKGLDLGWEHDEINDLIESEEQDDDGIISRIYFKDGSEIKFLDANDKIASFYVSEMEFESLKNSLSKIVWKFK